MLTSERGVLPGSDYYLGGDSIINSDLHIHLVSCGYHHCVEGYEIDRNYLDALLVAFIQDGTFRLRYEGEDYLAKAGDAIIIDCRKPQCYGAVEHAEFVWAHINNGNSTQLCHEINSKYGPVIRHDNIERVQEILMSILSAFRNEQSSSEYAISAQLFSMLCGYYASDFLSVRQDKNQLISSAIDYMKYHFRYNISVDDVAGSLHMSKHYFSRLFKEYTGFSPHNYLIKLRLDLAKHLLTTTQIPIRDIAFEVGYKSDMGLIMAFTEKVGISPGRYRKYPF